MNPPTALAGAMSRERKPFTYTPGGLDLSEIKSERMAQRLMRNAMNQGVPETPVQTIQSPPPSAAPMAMPNFNCLPVQVFPTFNLPANPKTLLRTRSNPDPVEKGPIKADRHVSDEPTKHSVLNKVLGNNKLQNNNDFNSANNSYSTPANYGSSGHTLSYLNNIKEVDNEAPLGPEFEKSKPYESIRPVYFNVPPVALPSIQTDYTNNTATRLSLPLEEYERSQNEKEEVTVTKERTNKEISSVSQNGNTEAAVTVKLPSKKSEAKTETKVEVVKNTLPDGSVQEVKTTTTRTTIDGRTEIKTETETTTYPKDYEEGVEYEEEVVEEEEETEDKDDNEQSEVVEEVTIHQKSVEINGDSEKKECEQSDNKEEAEKQNGQLIVKEEKHESSSTKKVVIQSETQDSEEEIEEVEEEEEIEEDNAEDVNVEEVIILKTTKESTETEVKEKEEITNEEDLKPEEDSVPNVKEIEENESEDNKQIPEKDEDVEEEELSEKYEDVETEREAKEEECEIVEEEEVEEEFEEVEDVKESEEVKTTEEVKEIVETKDEIVTETELPKNDEKPSEPEIPSKEEEKASEAETSKDEEKIIESEPKKEGEAKENIEPQEKEVPIKVVIESEVKENENVEMSEKSHLPTTFNVPLREPSIPLEKVEEVEIKPIGPAKEIITKTTTEIITKTSDKPVGTHSTQTQYNIVENIVTVNRTTKTLDHAYEEIPDNVSTSVPFSSSTLDRTLMSPQPIYKPYQPLYTPETQTERRHSLLLDRISVDRQMPSDIYQNSYQSNQTFEERQWSQEPQSEVLTVSNVKPSTVSKNQQWYQRNELDTSYPSSAPSSDIYSNNYQHQNQFKAPAPPQNIYQPKPTQPASQQIYQPQPRIQPSPQPSYQSPLPTHHQNTYQQKPQMQPSPQPMYQQPYAQSTAYSSPSSQPSYQTAQPVQSLYQPEPQYQSKFLETSTQSTYKSTSNNYQPSQPAYTSKPIWTGKSVEPQPYSSLESNQYSYLSKDSSENIQQSTHQFSSSYVPPPWEQDPNYVANNSSQFQVPTTPVTPSKEWKPPKTASKFSKPTPTSYIPPAPNQSFVKPVNSVEPPRQPGRKTYYSEYERRYISVPETTYIPHETKYQPQPDPSPQYYYDNNEPTEVVEPQWRKELREFKEQSKTTIQTEQTTVRPPWEDDPKYATPKDFTPTPTWTQTLKPRSWRERSYEPEYIGSQEWPKTNTLGRGRPQSSYVKGNLDRVPDRTRGVSVDRYNPNSYQSPLTKEHPPPASHILDPIVQGKTYHNPNVPAYHSRASAEPREQPISYQQPRQRESRATPVQSRSFKYLQWITGTED